MDKQTDMNKLTKHSGFIGEVVGPVREKTVKVKITHLYRHPIYRKAVKRSKKLLVHSDMELMSGDKVRIVETRPISRRKHFKVISKI